MTIIPVSHDLPEIFRLSDKVISHDKGKGIKHGRPANILPANIFLEEKLKDA